MKNWKTTMAAILGLLAIAATQGQAVLDGNPETVANWQIVLPAAIGCIGLIFAKDSKKAE
jgi:hypothetical protein